MTAYNAASLLYIRSVDLGVGDLGLKKLPNDAYVIRSLTKPDYFLKFTGKDAAGHNVYQLGEGTYGAAIWKLKDAECAVRQFGDVLLSPVPIRSVI